MRLLYSCSAAVALIACTAGARPGASMQAEVLVATLVPTNAAGNRITGTVRLSPTSKAGELRAQIEIRGGNFQNRFPWIVRSGQCGERGEEVGTPVAYRIIETTADGTARLNATVKITIPEGVTHHVDVLAGPSDRDHVISCGVLSAKAN